MVLLPEGGKLTLNDPFQPYDNLILLDLGQSTTLATLQNIITK